MDIRDQIKHNVAPCRIADKIVTGLGAMYNEIEAQEKDDKRRCTYFGVDPDIKMLLVVNSIYHFTFFYYEFLEVVLHYYGVLYIKMVDKLNSMETARPEFRTTLSIEVVIRNDDVYLNYYVSSGAFIAHVHPGVLSINTLKAAIAVQNNKRQLHNGMVANLVERRRAQRNIRIFADELLSVPVFGKHYLAAKERFEQAQRAQEVLVCGKMEIVDAEEPEGVAMISLSLSLTRKRKFANFQGVEATPILVIQ